MAAVSCGTSHASAVSTPHQWIFKKIKTCYKKIVTQVEPHASAVSLLKRVENSAIYKRSSISQKIKVISNNNVSLLLVCRRGMSGWRLSGAEFEDKLTSDWHLRAGALAETNAAGGA